MKKSIGTRGAKVILIILVIIFFIIEKLLLNNIIRVEGIKFGLYNLFIIFAIININPKFAFLLFGAKLAFGIVFISTAVIYPLFGGLLSVAAMALAYRMGKGKMGYIGVGIIGSLVYNITVYSAAAISVSSGAVFYNTPQMLILSVILGGATGSLAVLLSKSNIFVLNDGGSNEKK